MLIYAKYAVHDDERKHVITKMTDISVKVCLKSLRLVDSAFSDSQSEKHQSGENLACPEILFSISNLSAKKKLFKDSSRVNKLYKFFKHLFNFSRCFQVDQAIQA